MVVCLGSRASDLAELSGLPLRPCRGQNLHLENRAGLETPLICGKYIVPAGEGGDLLLCGATFEYDPEGLREPPSEAEAAAALLAPLEERGGEEGSWCGEACANVPASPRTGRRCCPRSETRRSCGAGTASPHCSVAL